MIQLYTKKSTYTIFHEIGYFCSTIDQK